MKSETKQVSAQVLLLAVLAAVLAAGCSGINASKSVSPLDFLLPGLHVRQATPAPACHGPLLLATTESILPDTTPDFPDR